VLLVGDMSYYGKMGFLPVPPGRLIFRPVDPDRLLYCELVAGAFEGVRARCGGPCDRSCASVCSGAVAQCVGG